MTFLLTMLAKNGEGGSFFGQSPKNEPQTLLNMRAKRATAGRLKIFDTIFSAINQFNNNDYFSIN
jgi:hypothetical protein